MFVALVICTVLLFSAQGDAVKREDVEAKAYMSKHKSFLGEMKSWLVTMAKDTELYVNVTTSEFQQLPNTLREEGKAQLSQHYLNTMQVLTSMSAPQQCIDAAKQQLVALHQNSISSFLSCKNLTKGVVDIVDMGVEIGKLTVEILLTADDVINGLGSCTSWNPFKFFYCTFNWAKRCLSDIYDSFKAIMDFNRNIAKLATDVKNQFNYCLHQGETVAAFDHVNIINIVKECSLKSN